MANIDPYRWPQYIASILARQNQQQPLLTPPTKPGMQHWQTYTTNPNLNRYGKLDLDAMFGGWGPKGGGAAELGANNAFGTQFPGQPIFPYQWPRSQPGLWGSNIYAYKW